MLIIIQYSASLPAGVMAVLSTGSSSTNPFTFDVYSGEAASRQLNLAPRLSQSTANHHERASLVLQHGWVAASGKQRGCQLENAGCWHTSTSSAHCSTLQSPVADQCHSVWVYTPLKRTAAPTHTEHALHGRHSANVVHHLADIVQRHCEQRGREHLKHANFVQV